MARKPSVPPTNDKPDLSASFAGSDMVEVAKQGLANGWVIGVVLD